MASESSAMGSKPAPARETSFASPASRMCSPVRSVSETSIASSNEMVIASMPRFKVADSNSGFTVSADASDGRYA